MNPIRRDLGLQLLALYLLFVGPVVLATLAFDRFAARRLEADVKAADLALARAIAQETNTAMDSALQAVRQMATYPAVIQADPEGMEPVFRTLMSARPDVNLVYRLDAQGTMLYHYPPGPGSTVGWDFSQRDYFQHALTTRSALLSEGRKSPTTQQPVATAVMPLWDDQGRFQGLVATNLKLQSLSHTLASIAAEYRQEEGFEVFIVDSAGQIIAHPNPPLLLQPLESSLPQLVQRVLGGQTGSRIQPDPQGEETLYSYVPIPSAGWGVIVSRPTAAAFATPIATHRGVGLLIGVFSVVGLFFWFALSRQVIKPLERLAVFSQTIGIEEEYPPAHRSALQHLSQRPDQIGHLIRSLSRMEDAIEARLRELSTLLDTSAAVVSSLDLQTVLDRILEQVEKLMGIDRCAIVALDEAHGVFRVRASRGLSQRYTEQLAISPSEPYSVTLRAIRSGEPIQISDTEQDSSFASARPRARAEGYRSILAVPLNTQHGSPSALLVYRPDPHSFTPREVSLLTSFANHATMAIENANLYARSDLRLREQTRRLEALIQSLNDGLILENLEGRVLYANRRISEMVGLEPDEISGIPVTHLIERLLTQTAHAEPGLLASNERDGQARQAVYAALSGEGPRRVEVALNVARPTRYLRLSVFDVTDSNGASIGRGQIWRDITQNREIDRMKSSLVSTVSHELRTPLAGIKGYVSTLLAEDVQWDSLTQREFLEIISGETDRLSDLVSDLLDISRIEAGNLIVAREPCRLEELVERAAHRAHPAPKDRLQLSLPPDLPQIYADPQRIEAVLRNLLENAAKYAPGETPICVSAAIQGRTVEVRVEDQGPGIPLEDSHKVFESFYRLENGLTRSAPGAGLGLAICQGFIQAHSGRIWLEPRPRGTCIAFSLPLEAPHAA